MSKYQETQPAKFRLVFTDPADLTPERAQQTFAANYESAEARKWVDGLLAAGGPDCYVTVYETIEQTIKHIRKPRPEKTDVANAK